MEVERINNTISHLKSKGDGVDGDDLLSGVILQRAGQEGLREKEPRDPEHRGDPIVHPALDKLHAVSQISHPGREGLEGGVRLARPHVRNLVVEQTIGHFFQGL